MKKLNILGLVLLLAACKRDDIPEETKATNAEQLPAAPSVITSPMGGGDVNGGPQILPPTVRVLPTVPGPSTPTDPLIRNMLTSYLERESLPKEQVMYVTEGQNSNSEAVTVEFADSIAFDPSNMVVDCMDTYTRPFALRATVENGQVRLRYCKDDKTDVKVKFQDSRAWQVGLAVVTNKADGKRNPVIVFKGTLGFQCLSPNLSGKVDVSNQQPTSDIAECRTGLDRIQYKDGDSFFTIMDRANPERKLIEIPFMRTRKLVDYPLMGAEQLKIAGVKDFASLEKLLKSFYAENLFSQAERLEVVNYIDSLTLEGNDKLKLNTLIGSDRFYDLAETLNRRLDPNGVATEVVTTEQAWLETVGDILYYVRRLNLQKLTNALRFVMPSLKKSIMPQDATPAEIGRAAASVKAFMKVQKFRVPIETLKREVEGNSTNAPAVCVDDNSSEICRDLRVVLKILLP